MTRHLGAISSLTVGCLLLNDCEELAASSESAHLLLWSEDQTAEALGSPISVLGERGHRSHPDGHGEASEDSSQHAVPVHTPGAETQAGHRI